MRDYAVNDYGLLMTIEMMQMIASKVCDDYTDEDYKDDPYPFNGELYDKGIVEYIGDFTGESIEINDDGTVNWGVSEYYSADIIWYVPTKNISTLFKAAYKDIDEMIEEFRERFGKYFPADFDYRKYIRHISGTYYG
jgi:hypothetical protein